MFTIYRCQNLYRCVLHTVWMIHVSVETSEQTLKYHAYTGFAYHNHSLNKKLKNNIKVNNTVLTFSNR